MGAGNLVEADSSSGSGLFRLRYTANSVFWPVGTTNAPGPFFAPASEPFWVRVILEEQPGASNRLLVASHGRSLVIGEFVPPATRRELASTLRDVLTRWRNSLNPARQ